MALRPPLTTGDPLLDFALSLRSGWLTPIMKGISDANSEYAYLAILPLIYWLFSTRVGFALMLADASGTFAAVALKAGLGLPRPPNSGESAWLASPTGAGFPSGHTTAAATTWFSLAGTLRSRRLAAWGALVSVAVGFSRLYLGVHYTRDVVGAIFIGSALGALLWVGLPRIEAAVGRLDFKRRLLLLLVFPAFAILNNSPEALIILSTAGGAGLGQIISNRLGWKLDGGGPWRLPFYGMLRIIIGVPVLGLFAIGLGDPTTAAPAIILARFTGLGAFVTLVGPRTFVAVESRLSRKPKDSPST
jgi:membrane-associated phospholipid phosphatase